MSKCRLFHRWRLHPVIDRVGLDIWLMCTRCKKEKIKHFFDIWESDACYQRYMFEDSFDKYREGIS